MLGRGKRSAPQKGKGSGEDGGDDKTRRAAVQATKAEEAAEAARLAEEAADRAREAARLAQIAAEAAAADAATETEAETEPETEAPAKAEKALKTAVKPRRTKKAPESEPGDGEPAADESAAVEADADTVADADDADTVVEPAPKKPSGKASKTPNDEDDETDEDDDDDASDASEDDDEDGDEAEDEAEVEDDDEAEAKRGRIKSALTFKKTAKSPKIAKVDDGPVRVGTGGFALLAVLTVLVLAFGTAATLLFLADRHEGSIDDARRDGLWAASKAAKDLASYDYRTLDVDTKAAAATTTGKLHDDYVKSLPNFKAQAAAQQAVSAMTVMKTGAISATSDKVVALVYADRSAVTKNDKQQQLPEPLRLKMTMVKVHGKWLAEKVEVIS